MLSSLYSPLFFFFQAEDGIRDTSVTGVQTCALPILRQLVQPGTVRAALRAALGAADLPGAPASRLRSEERRVGKECKSGWAPADKKHKMANVYTNGNESWRVC